jgi:transcriptional regulator with XRE-family HTH domain
MSRSAEDWSRLGREVRRARKAAGFTDTIKWAQAVGRSSRVVLGLERGEPTGDETLELVSLALGKDVDWCRRVLDREDASARPELDPSSGWKLHEIDVGDDEVSVRLSRRDGNRLRPADVVRSLVLSSRFLEATGEDLTDRDWLVKVDRMAAEGAISSAAYEFDRAARARAVAAYDLAARSGQPEQARIVAAEPDPNADPEGPEAGA